MQLRMCGAMPAIFLNHWLHRISTLDLCIRVVPSTSVHSAVDSLLAPAFCVEIFCMVNNLKGNLLRLNLLQCLKNVSIPN